MECLVKDGTKNHFVSCCNVLHVPGIITEHLLSCINLAL